MVQLFGQSGGLIFYNTQLVPRNSTHPPRSLEADIKVLLGLYPCPYSPDFWNHMTKIIDLFLNKTTLLKLDKELMMFKNFKH